MKMILIILAAVVFTGALAFLGFGYVWYGIIMLAIAIIFTMGYVLMEKEDELNEHRRYIAANSRMRIRVIV